MIGYAISMARALASRHEWLLVAASYLLVAVLASCAGRSTVERERRFERALYAQNLEAVQDTSRRLQLRVSSLGESLVVTQRHAVQEAQRGDALDKALRLERRARVAATVELPRVRARIEGDVAVPSDSVARGDDVRRAHFALNETWYSGSADVALPRLPGRAELSLDLGMRAIPLELRIGCSASRTGGVAAATASVTAPTWAKLTLSSVEQDPAVCSPMPTAAAAHRSLTAALRERLAVVVGYGVTSTQWKPGGVLAAGIRLW